MTDSPKCFHGSELRFHGSLEALLAEYEAMNALLRFRLDALDRRLPLLAALVGGALAAVPTLPPLPALVFLVILPVSAGWLSCTAVSHARSKEDHLARIAALERDVNHLLGVPVLGFQSAHPSRGRVTAGRSGFASVSATAAGAVAVLVGCGGFFYVQNPLPAALIAYSIYLASVAGFVLIPLLRLARYRSSRRSQPGPAAEKSLEKPA